MKIHTHEWQAGGIGPGCVIPPANASGKPSMMDCGPPFAFMLAVIGKQRAPAAVMKIPRLQAAAGALTR